MIEEVPVDQGTGGRPVGHVLVVAHSPDKFFAGMVKVELETDVLLVGGMDSDPVNCSCSMKIFVA
jgi:hypothetical protein